MLVMNQINRLKSRFGEKAFDDEFVKLAVRELMQMADGNVIRSVDVWIGNRPANRPPLLDDFRQARLTEERVRLQNDISGALQTVNSGPREQGLKAYLAKEFPGCKTLAEAIEVRRLQIKIAKADDPNYDPMTDPKWMGTP